MVPEKMNALRIGQEHDNYVMHSIKHKSYEAMLYLFTLPNVRFDPKEKNGQGNTSFHLAVKTG